MRHSSVVGFILPFIILLTWWFFSYFEFVPGYLVPSPGKLSVSIFKLFFGTQGTDQLSGTFFRHAAASILRVLSGFMLAAVLGISLGLMSGRSRYVRQFLEPTLHAVRGIPGIAWLPLAMIWFGIGNATTVFLIAMAAFFPIYINTAHASASVSTILIRSASMLGTRGVNLYLYCIIPASMPSIVSGLRIGMGLAWAYVVLGELTGVTSGLGAMLMDARMMGDTVTIVMTMVLIALVSKSCDIILIQSSSFLPCMRYLQTINNDVVQ